MNYVALKGKDINKLKVWIIKVIPNKGNVT